VECANRIESNQIKCMSSNVKFVAVVRYADYCMVSDEDVRDGLVPRTRKMLSVDLESCQLTVVRFT
jgi:predicted phosphoribosyltransferase